MRSCHHQSFSPGINNSAESLQRMRSQKIQVAALRENDFVNGFEPVNSKNRIANITRYDLAIPHYEFHIALADVDSYCRQRLTWKPGEFRAGVHDKLFDD